MRLKNAAGHFDSYGSLATVAKGVAIIVNGVDQILDRECVIVYALDEIRLNLRLAKPRAGDGNAFVSSMDELD